MVFDSVYITYVWMVPVLIFLILPLMLGVTVFLVFLALRVVFPDKPLHEKRKHPRFTPRKIDSTEIIVGTITCTGLICDISRMGICLKNLPDMLFETMEQLPIIIRAYGEDHRLLISPKWVVATASGKQIGAEIYTASPCWGQFLQQVEKTSLPIVK